MSDPDTSRLLGELKGTMAGIQRQLADSETRATESREMVHEQLRDIRKDAQDTRARTAAMEKTLKEDVLPMVRSVDDWRSRALGGMVVLGAIGTVVLFILTLARDAILDIWRDLMR